MTHLKLVDEIFEMYRNKLTEDEEDLDMVTFAVLENFDRKELLELIEEMDDHELQYFVRLYLLESLKGKFAQVDENYQYESKNLH